MDVLEYSLLEFEAGQLVTKLISEISRFLWCFVRTRRVPGVICEIELEM